MRKRLALISVLFFVLLFAASSAIASMLYVDVAPNKFAKPDRYEKWWERSKKRITKGNFVSMRRSANADNKGTTNFEIEDSVVYEFGNGGSRLTFIYWLPGETIESLTDSSFQISANYFWDEKKYSYTKDYFGERWLTPNTWEEVTYGKEDQYFGVFGTAGIGFNASELGIEGRRELPFAYQFFDSHVGDIIFKTRRDGQKSSLRAYHQPSPVPEPSTVLLFGAGLLGIVGFKRKIFT